MALEHSVNVSYIFFVNLEGRKTHSLPCGGCIFSITPNLDLVLKTAALFSDLKRMLCGHFFFPVCTSEFKTANYVCVNLAQSICSVSI